jgi:uncharacterized membrane protein
MLNRLVRYFAFFPLLVVATCVCSGQGGGNPRLNLTVSPAERAVPAGGGATFDVSVKGVGNFNGAVALRTSPVAAGIAVSITPATLNVKNGQQSEASATVAVAEQMTPGRYLINFVADGGAVFDTASVVLVISSSASASAFEFHAAPDERTVSRGNQVGFDLTLTTAAAAPLTVNLSLKSAPIGISAVFAPSSTVVVSGGNIRAVAAAVKVDASVQPGDYQIVFAADSSSTHREQTVRLHVLGVEGTFDFDASPGFRRLLPSAQLFFTLTLAPRNGFQGMVSLTAGGLPPGASVAFQPGSPIALTPGGATLVTAVITTGPAVLAGDFQVRFSADSGSIHREQAVVLGSLAEPVFSLEVVPGTVSVAPGGAAKLALLVNAGSGFSGPVKLTVQKLPNGATAAFDPSDTVQLSSGKTSAIALTVQTAAGTPPGDYPLLIAADAGTTSEQKMVTLRVAQLESFTMTVTPLTRTVPPGGAASYELTLASVGQFAGSIDVGTGSLPPGVAIQFTPESTVVLPVGGSAKMIATLMTTLATPPSAYTIGFTARSGGVQRQASVRLGVEGGALFNFTAAPLLRIVAPGSVATYSISLSSLDNFAGTVYVTPGALPSGVSLTLNPASPVTLQTGQSVGVTAQLAVAPGVPEGKYPIRFTASSSGSSSDALVMLWVTTEQGFHLDAVPDSRDVSPGNAAAYTLRLTSIGDFSGLVQLSVQGLPSGSSASFQPGTSVTLYPGQIQTVTATVSTTASTPLGAATLKFSADAAGLHREDNVALNVIANAGFRLELSPSSRVAAPGSSVTYAATIWSIGGYAGPVNLTVDGLPSGFTAALDPGNPIQLAAGGIQPVQVTVTVPAEAGAGVVQFQLTARSGGMEAAAAGKVVVNAEKALRLSIAPSQQTVARGQSVTYAVKVASLAYQGPVSLRTVGLPPGANVFNPAGALTIKPGETIDVLLSVTPGAGASLGTHVFAVLADTFAIGVAEADAKLVVVDNLVRPEFTIMVVPPSRVVNSGATAVFKVFVSSVNAFRGSIDLSVQGLPPGEFKWEADDSVFLAAGETRSATLLVKTDKSAPEKLYQLLFTADSAGVHREATGLLVVVKTPSGDDDDEDEDGDR